MAEQRNAAPKQREKPPAYKLPQQVEDAIRRGFSVMPCNPNRKPCLPTWKEFQTRRPTREEIEQWDRQYQPLVWAVITGANSGVIVLDFDGAEGNELMNKLGLQPHVRTQSGGHHCYFKHPGWHVATLNGNAKAELGKRYPGLDIRADAGYANLNGQGGKGRYTVLRPLVLDSLEKLPTEMREFLGLAHPPAADTKATTPFLPRARRSRDSRPSAEQLIHRALDKVAGEGRNDAGFWLAGQLRDNGYSEAETRDAGQRFVSQVPATNTKGQKEPYTMREFEASLQSALSRERREPWGLRADLEDLRP